MNKKNSITFIVIALILVACDLVKPTPTPRPASAPTPTIVTRTPTLSPTPEITRTPGPTNTLVVPLVTVDPNQPTLPPPIIARATGSPTPRPTRRPINPNDPIAVAWDKVEKASRYRSQMNWVIGVTTNGKSEEVTFLDLLTAINGSDAQIVGKGLMTILFTGDPDRAFETIRVGGKTYTKGIINLDSNVWYVSDASSSNSTFGSTSDQHDWTNDARSDDFKRARVENFDNQICDVYFADLRSSQADQLKKTIGAAKDTNVLGALDVAEGWLWLCRDGYMHKITMEYAGHNPQNENEKGSLKLLLRFWDFNSSTIVIQAPRDARPMPK